MEEEKLSAAEGVGDYAVLGVPSRQLFVRTALIELFPAFLFPAIVPAAFPTHKTGPVHARSRCTHIGEGCAGRTINRRVLITILFMLFLIFTIVVYDRQRRTRDVPNGF